MYEMTFLTSEFNNNNPLVLSHAVKLNGVALMQGKEPSEVKLSAGAAMLFASVNNPLVQQYRKTTMK